MGLNSEKKTKDMVVSGQNEKTPSEGFMRYFQWINEDWLSLFVGLIIVLLALLGLLDWITW
ncbi:MAG: hypothetical protein ACFFCU_19490 [Promethearchaeota archaeon]